MDRRVDDLLQELRDHLHDLLNLQDHLQERREGGEREEVHGREGLLHECLLRPGILAVRRGADQ